MRLKIKSIMLAVLGVTALLLSCADVPSEGPTPPEFFAEFRFFSAAFDAGSVSVSVDGEGVGSASFAGSIAHQQFLAGSRMVSAGGVDQPIAMDTDQRGTVVILPDLGSGRSLLKLAERRIFDSEATSQAMFRVVHAANAPDITVSITDSEGHVEEASVTFGQISNNYITLAGGAFMLSIVSDDGTVNIQGDLSLSNRRLTQVLVGNPTDGLSLVDLND